MKLIVAGVARSTDYTLLSRRARPRIVTTSPKLLHGGARGADPPRLSLGRAASRALALLRSGLGALREGRRRTPQSPDGAGRGRAGGVSCP